jgi:transcriptional regulator with GAF, ATPase, and Fis domain
LERWEEADVFAKAKEFLEAFRKGEEFTKDLLKENERLRYKVVNLEEQLKNAQTAGGDASVVLIKSEYEKLKQEVQSLKDRYSAVEAENRDFAARHVEVEEENNNLANLYVASYQLHSTLDYNEVVRIILEIVINLVGADRFAILVLDENHEDLQLVASEGMDEKPLKRMKVGKDILGEVVKTGQSHLESDLTHVPMDNNDQPVVCIPLKIKERVIGALAIYSLLEQKRKKLTRVDYELFSMLAGHAATALFSSKLYSQSERKLSTIQGFLNLLSGKEGGEG